MKIVSWQSVLTDHQSHTFRALQKITQESVLIVSGVRELPERQEQGWMTPDISGMHVRYLPSSGWWKAGLAILRENRDAIHLFNGLWGDRRFFPLLIEAQRQGIQTGLVTEPYAEVSVGYLSEGSLLAGRIKAKLRPWLYRLAGLLVAKRFCAVFAISEKAVQQFLSIGVRAESIFPFGYFVPALQVEEIAPGKARPGVHIVFVGSLLKIKGIRILVDAVKICNSNGVKLTLDVYGAGDASVLVGEKNIRYKGVIPFGQAQRVIADYDLLVLPSLHDGWGVVVNESLLQGVPVLVSDQVGAKVLVEKSKAGAVVSADNADELAKCLEDISRNPECLELWRNAAKIFRPKVMPEVAAGYLFDCLQHVLSEDGDKPCSPWCAHDIANI